ncbi:MAG: hypothetical protein K2G39_05775, partial [Lachnospiraceae bacterium]|nr:hypothetical protein [Lachnospiraceae bacterium]
CICMEWIDKPMRYVSRCISFVENRGGGGKLTVIWPVDRDCGIHFYDVFADDIFDDIELRVVEENKLETPNSIYMRKEQWLKEKLPVYIFREKYIDFTPPRWSGESHTRHLKNAYKRVRKELSAKKEVYIKAYCGIIKDKERENVDYTVIRFRRNYWKQVDRILESDTKYIGVHIRRTDHNQAIQESSTERFIQQIRKMVNEQEDLKIFLATDDIREQNIMKNVFGDRLVTQKGKRWGRDSSSKMKSGIIDCLCLSQCMCVLGSNTSVFSSFSAKYGKKELIVCRNEDGK